MTRKPLVERLKDAIRSAERRGITRYRIAQESGISEGQLSRLMSGKVAPRLDTSARIADAAGFNIKIIRKERLTRRK
jgi:transcriptional regulator with XRE-family HTH domain